MGFSFIRIGQLDLTEGVLTGMTTKITKNNWDAKCDERVEEQVTNRANKLFDDYLREKGGVL